MLNESNYRQALELVRLALSSLSRQSWGEDEDKYHFYSTSKGDSGKVDIGIAIALFDLYLKDQGIIGVIVVETNHILDDYIATWILM